MDVLNFLITFNRLWLKITIRRRLQMGLIFLLMIFTSLMEIVSIGALLPFLAALTNPEKVFNHPLAQPFIEYLNLTDQQDIVVPLTVVFILAILISNMMRLTLLWSQSRMSFGVGADISIDIYNRTLHQPYSVHLSRNSSEIITGISSRVNNTVHHTILPILNILNAILMTLSIVSILIVIEPKVAISTMASFGIIYMIIAITMKKTLDRNGARMNREQNNIIKALQEGLGGIRDVIIDGSQKYYCYIFSKADQPLRRAQANLQIISAAPRFIIEALSMMIIALVALYFSINIEGGMINAIPVLGAIAMGSQRLLPVIQQAFASWSFIRSGRASLNDVLELLDQPLPEKIDIDSLVPITFKESIKLHNLSYSYTLNGESILKNINLNIRKGSCIGLIGATGSGKSTLLDIVMGLLSPVKGNLLVDGIKITSLNQRSWQSHIAHVPQHIYLSDATILENIAFGVKLEDIDFDRAQEAAEKAQIAKTIESWDLGFQELVGEGGVRLSGGQRQRIGIARAFYKKADVIVFDEATSALDGEVESLVIDSIAKLNKEVTIIMVAHRHSTLKNCTEVIKLSDGSFLSNEIKTI